MKQIRLVVLSCLSFLLAICTFCLPLSALENGVYIDGEYIRYDVEENNNETKDVFAYDSIGNEVLHLIFIDEKVFEEKENGELHVVAYIEDLESSKYNSIQPKAIQPNWGGMISERKRVIFPNDESNLLLIVPGILIGAVFPGAAIPYAIASGIAQYVASKSPRYIDMTCYYRVAAGCPQYRWYDRYEYRNQSGALFKTVSLNRKSFIGVPNSPQNPPACRSYGF